MKQILLSILFFVATGSNPRQNIKPDSIYVSVPKVEIDSTVYNTHLNKDLERHTDNAKQIKQQSKIVLKESLRLLEKAKEMEIQKQSDDAFMFYQKNKVIE